MGKIVKAVLVIAAAVAIIAFAPEIAGAIGFMAQGFALTAATVAAISSALVGIALSVGLSAVMSLFQKTPNLSQSLADRQDLNPDPTAPRKMVFGNTAAGTDVRFKESWGKKSDRLSLVIALASHQLTSVQSVTMDSVEVWANGRDISGNKYDDGYDEVSPYLLGTPTNGRSVGTGSFWNRSSTFTGCAYSVITYCCDKTKVWTNGLPSKVIHVVEGCPVYDPRADSTNGGSGSQRPNNQATWQYHVNNVAVGRNPALCLLTYLIGWRVNGILMWGMGLPIDAIEMSSFIQYANLCEEQVQTSTGGTTQRYTCDGIFSTNDSHETITNSICLCMGTAILVDTNGLFQIIEGYDDTLTTPYALTQDDVISSGVWTPSPEVRNRVTRVSGRFADPSQQYTLTTWGTVDVDPFFDGIPRVQTTDFNCVGRAETCQRIAKQLLVKSKYCGIYTAVFGYRAFAATVGSLVTLSGVQGFNNKLFRVISSEETFDLTYQLTLREESPEVYEWDASEEKPLPANIFATTFDPIDAEDVGGLTINSTAVEGTNSVTTIFVDVDWTPATSIRTTSIEIQSQKLGDTVWTVEAERFDPLAGTFRFGAGVNGAGIQVQARYRMDNGAYGPWVTANLSSTPVSNTNQWSAVYDNGDGTKPADSATNTRDPSTPLGGGGDTVGTIVNQTGDNTAALTDPSTNKLYKISDIVTNVDDLTATYGSTSSAAASAAAAASSQSAAATAATNAQQASDNATTAKNAASASATAADAAKAAALGYQTGAQTAQTNAQTAATNASTANTAAKAAQTAAEGARDLALTYETGAQTAKTAAETAATNASSSAGTASSQATLAAGANSAANAAAASLFPERLDNTSAAFTTADVGAPSSVTPIPATGYGNIAGYGVAAISTLTGTSAYATRTVALLPFIAGRFYKVEAELAMTSIASGDAALGAVYMTVLDSSYAKLSSVAGTARTNVLTGGITVSAVFGCNATGGDANITIANAAWLRPFAQIDHTGSGSDQAQFRRIKVTDVTSQILAGQSAGAASTSASNASASATTASQQATIATNEATTATTKAGDASTYANNAASSATSAAGSATTATTQAGVAATQAGNAAGSATGAANSATAAAGSASTASTKATDAGTSATSAAASATSASTSAGQANTYASNASTSATNAAGSATSAATQAGVSATSATNAANAQNAAEAAAAQLLPSRIDAAGTYFFDQAYIGDPLIRAMSATGKSRIINESGYGYVYSYPMAVGGPSYLSMVGVVPATTGTIYEVTATFECVTYAAAFVMSVWPIWMDGSYAQVGSNPTKGVAFSATGTQTVKFRVSDVAPSNGVAWPAGTSYVRFLTGVTTAGTGSVVYLKSITVNDVTAQAAAESQASAAATSASNAATSATAAGTSATSASNSATIATTAAGTAQTYANNASTSATNAQGYSNTASTQAGVATSSANTAALTAAQTLPTDFTQQGQFFYSGFQGSPSAALNTSVSTAVTFTTVAGLGPVALVAPAVGANVDTSMAGVLTVAPGRFYKLTLTYQGKTASPGLVVNPYIIGLNSAYSYIAAGSTSASVAVSDTALHTATIQINGDTVIAAGCNAIRALLRVGISAAGTAGGSVYLVSAVLEDETAQSQAAASATAAAGSASTASTAATNAGTSATSAQTAATNASTSAGQAQTYSNNASTSATNAAGSATTATTQAGVAASNAAASTQTVAQTLPTDFQNDGQFWASANVGAPTRQSITPTAVYSFPATGNYMICTPTVGTQSSADVSNLGAITVQSGRTYQISANFTVTNIGTGGSNPTFTLYGIYLNSSYAQTVNGAINLTTVSANGTYTMTMPPITGDAVLASGSNTGTMLRALFRCNLISNARIGLVYQLNNLTLEDITERTAAANSASAAATSASNAGISATNAGTSATAAAASATQASTSAGNAQTYASNASTSATNAAGSATSATTQAGVSASSADAAQAAAQGTFPTTFEQGVTYFGGDTANPNPLNMITATSSDGLPVLQTSSAGYSIVSWEQAMPYISGRTYRITAKVKSTTTTGGTCHLRISVYDKSTGGTRAGLAESVNETVTTAWQTFTFVATLTLTGSFVRPEVVLNYAPSVSGVTQQIALIQLEDITESTLATAQATAAATSASNAAISATNAGTSASSAQSSATTASTQATNAAGSASSAQTYAGQASTSATNAQGYANTASTQAGAASTSATNSANSATAAAGSASTATTQAGNASNSASAANSANVSAQSAASQANTTAAALMPSDFSQQGQFWAASYAGAPSARTPLAANSNVAYTTVTGVGPVIQITPAANASYDFAEIGVMPVAAGRRYRATCVYRMSSLGTGTAPALNLYIIGLNSAYGNVTNVEVNHTPTAINTNYTVTVEQSGDTLLAAGNSYMRILPRSNNNSGGSGAVFQYLTVLLEDITDQYNAGNSATAAANSATTATAQANAASGSATAASTSANTALTQAGNAQNSATAAAGSAATSTAQAAAASASATLAAAVGSGDTNLNSMFGNWPTATAFPGFWGNGAGVTAGSNLTRVAGITSTYAARVTSAAAQSTYLYQGGGNAPWDANVGDWIVLEADIALNSGSLVGSGVLFRVNGSGEIILNFATDPATSDAVVGAGVAGNPYSFRKLIQITAGGNTSTQFYAMNAWTSLGSVAGSNDITWYRCGWRPATSAEIAGKRADANAATALSQITQEQSTRAAADAALTTSVNTLTAVVNTNPNLLQNPTGANGFNGWTFDSGAQGFSNQQGSSEGYFFWQNNASGSANVFHGFYQDVPVYAGVGYSLQGGVSAAGLISTALARLYMEFLNSAKSHIGYSNGGSVEQIAGGNSWTQLGRNGNLNQVTPAGTAYIRVHCDVGSTSAWSANNVAWRRLKLEQGGACTQYTDDGTAAQLSASVSTQAGAIASIEGKTQAYWQTTVNAGAGQAFISATALDQNNNPTSSVGIGATNFSVYNPSGGNYLKALEVDNGNITISGDFYGGAGKMVWSNGSVMKVQGTGFGTSNQFIEWFGPVMAIASCAENNATMYLRTDGAAYFGGALSAGTLTTKAATSDQGASATAETNVFGSNGHTITVTVSYNAGYSQNASYTSSQLASFNASASAVGANAGNNYNVGGSDPGGWSVAIYRSINGAGYAQVATLTGSGTWSWFGQPPGNGDPGFARIGNSEGGSITYTDPQNIAQNRQYKAVLTARNPKFGITAQQISIVCVEA